jgi:hypothetical protein
MHVLYLKLLKNEGVLTKMGEKISQMLYILNPSHHEYKHGGHWNLLGGGSGVPT